jgi:flagellar capping protein FliD
MISGSSKKCEKVRKFLESNENENTTYQTLWDALQALLRGKFTAMNAYIKKS